jgi:hypothetical protein
MGSGFGRMRTKTNNTTTRRTDVKVSVKTESGRVDIALTYATNKAPAKLSLSKSEFAHLLKLLETAARADSFKLELELPS